MLANMQNQRLNKRTRVPKNFKYSQIHSISNKENIRENVVFIT